MTVKIVPTLDAGPDISPERALAIIKTLGGNFRWPDDYREWPGVRQAYITLAREFLAAAPPYPADRYSGDGVVMLGGGNYWTSTYVSLRMLRESGCTLPVQLWYFEHADEMPAARQKLLEPLGVECVPVERAHHLRPFRGPLGGWQAKALAVLDCPFRRVLYLDADCYPVVNPEYLLGHHQFLAKGALFWPDGEFDKLPERTWKVFGLQYHDEAAFESGQFLIDKQKWWRAALLAWHYNDHSDYYYHWAGNRDPARIIYGDKDTWHMAAWVADQPYGVLTNFCHHNNEAYLHHDDQNRLVFVHRCRSKMRRPREHFGTTAQPPRPVPLPGIPGEEKAFAFLHELDSLERGGGTAPRPPWPVNLCVPTLNRYDLLARLVRAARAGSLPPNRIVVLDNGGECPQIEGAEIIRPGRNLGVAASWNWFLHNVADGVVIANDDVLPDHDALEKLCRAAQHDPTGLAFTAGDAEAGMFRWSLFLARRQLLWDVGQFDEALWPAYYEDNDMERRLALAGRPAVRVAGVGFTHFRSATARGLSAEQLRQHQECYHKNKEHYVAKWGGEPGRERYDRPFARQFDWESIPGAFDFQDVYRDAVAAAPRGGTLVEVGCYFGRSLAFLAGTARQSGKGLRVWGVDWGKGSPESPGQLAEARSLGGTFAAKLTENIARAGLADDVRLLIADSAEAAARFNDQSLDFVFLDAGHAAAAVLRDLVAWWPKVRPGGTLAGHDYDNGEWPAVGPVVRSFFARRSLDVVAAGHSWLVKKPTLTPGEQARLSVVLPTIGRPSLRAALRSLAGQDWRKGDELIVVADDNTGAVRAAVALFPGVPAVLLRTPRRLGGYGGPARNLGMARCSGDWIAFLDDDDVMTADSFRAIRYIAGQMPQRRPLLFKVNGTARGTVWDKPVFAAGNLTTSGIVVPNEPGLLPQWDVQYDCDARFLRELCDRYGRNPVFRPEVLASYRGR
jgi:GT2 family glycosyltransferase